MKSEASQPTRLDRRFTTKLFRATVVLVTLLPFVTLSANSSPAVASTSTRTGGICVSELQWASLPSTMKNPSGQLICLKTAKGLRWQDPGKVIVDAHLNSILVKCGSQLQHLEVTKIDAKILSANQLAITNYVSKQLHLRVVRFEPSFGFYTLNVKYYRQIGMCSHGVGSVPYYTGPDSRIPADSNLLWESVAYCQIGPQTVPLNFAFARVGNSWKFVALGGINSQPVYM